MISSFAWPRASSLATSAPKARGRAFSTTAILRTTPGRTANFNSGFTSSYDPNDEGGRGPMFSKTSVGVPQFYPRDLKKRVDEYVVGQDRAKKSISSVIFNHYQNLRRRQYQEEQERKREEKLMRQARNFREREPRPVEGWCTSRYASRISVLTTSCKMIIPDTTCTKHGNNPNKMSSSFIYLKILITKHRLRSIRAIFS